jgi:hypothetical protein
VYSGKLIPSNSKKLGFYSTVIGERKDNNVI